MLLSKTVIAALIATAAGGIIIGSATTYVVVNNNGCNWAFDPSRYTSEETRKWVRTPTDLSDDEGGRRVTTDYVPVIKRDKQRKENGDNAKE